MKGPGSRGLPTRNEYVPMGIVQKLEGIFNECLEGANVSTQWKLAYVSSIHKKGSKLRRENYKRISISSSVGCLYGRILTLRLELETQKTEEQSGFRPDRSCVDSIFSLKQLAEQNHFG